MALRVVKTWVHHGNHENRVFSTQRRNEANKASTLGKQKKEIQISYERFPKEQENKSLVNNFFKPLKQTFFSDAVSQWLSMICLSGLFTSQTGKRWEGFTQKFFCDFSQFLSHLFSLRAPTPKNWEGGQTQRSTNWSRSSTDNPVIGVWHLIWKTNPDKSPTNLVNAPPTRAKRVRSCECLHLSIHHSFTAVSACAFYFYFIF